MSTEVSVLRMKTLRRRAFELGTDIYRVVQFDAEQQRMPHAEDVAEEKHFAVPERVGVP